MASTVYETDNCDGDTGTHDLPYRDRDTGTHDLCDTDAVHFQLINCPLRANLAIYN